MNKSLRKAIIAGNWKMNKTRPEAKALLEAIKPLVANAEGKIEVIACVPFTNLETAVNTTAGSNVKVGAENVHFEKSGAFTGEISADMLTELGVEYVVIGQYDATVDIDAIKNDIIEKSGRVSEDLNNPFRLSVSVGYVVIDSENDLGNEEYFRMADEAMYEMKRKAHEEG